VISMPVAPGLLDTSVLIDYLDGWPNRIQFVVAIRATDMTRLSQITSMILIARCLNVGDRNAVRAMFTNSLEYPITTHIVRRAYRILDVSHPPTALSANDAIIAATATFHKLPLYTLDPARFVGVSGLNAIQPY